MAVFILPPTSLADVSLPRLTTREKMFVLVTHTSPRGEFMKTYPRDRILVLAILAGTISYFVLPFLLIFVIEQIMERNYENKCNGSLQ